MIHVITFTIQELHDMLKGWPVNLTVDGTKYIFHEEQAYRRKQGGDIERYAEEAMVVMQFKIEKEQRKLLHREIDSRIDAKLEPLLKILQINPSVVQIPCMCDDDELCPICAPHKVKT